MKKNKPMPSMTHTASGPSRENSRSDKALGMPQDITRRDFLDATLLASGGLLLAPVSPAQLLAKAAAKSVENSANDDWTGYGGVGDYASSNGNTTGVMEAGHQIREG